MAKTYVSAHRFLPPVHILAVGPLIFGAILFVRIIVVTPHDEAQMPARSHALLQRQLELQRVNNPVDETELEVVYSPLSIWGDEEKKPLRWRGVAYGPELEQDGEIYGGNHTAERFAARGFGKPVMDDSWNVLFTHTPMSKWLMRHPDVLGLAHPEPQVRLVNHCEYFTAAGDKCAFAEHLSRIKTNHPSLATFELHDDAQYVRWQEEVQKDHHRYWVVKDCTNGASQGIKLLHGRAVRRSAPPPGTWAVAQEFLANPYMSWGGHKFHMRLYVLATRWDPVGAFVFNEGIVFQSRSKYHNHKPSLRKDIFSSVSEKVRLMQLGKLWQHLDRAGKDPSKVWGRVVSLLKDVLGTGLQESFGDPGHLSKRGFSCFDLFGVDVILDQQLQPYVLEINIGPNLWVDAEYEMMQRKIKGPLLDQVANWARLRVENQSTATVEPTLDEKIALENLSLLDFERLL